ncbi:MAG: hypothetical protein U9R44_02575, partial [Candidatus Omnitrophota bacterium]|nr:hypothetical protein [Candidatus Omnitrophota bacterium]
MKRLLTCKKGFTLTEVMFAAVVTVMIIGTIMSVWLFTYRTWIEKSHQTELRMDMMKALETIKNDLRYSSLTYVSFYPNTGPPYSAISFPTAEPDENGLFALDGNGEVDWDNMLYYYIYPAGGNTMRRTVEPLTGGVEKDDATRYGQLATVVSAGAGGSGSETDDNFLVNVNIFQIIPLAPIIEFYDESSTPVRIGKVIFGWVKLGSGDHTIRFEVTGKNDLSSGYDIGIDNLMIEPSGSQREAEYYNSSFAPSGALTISGGTAGRVHDIVWSHDNYLEFDFSGEGDYAEFGDSYDLWRESSFSVASLDNTEMVDEEIHVKLDVPEGNEAGRFVWYSHVEAGDTIPGGSDGNLPGGTPVTIRTIVTPDNIDLDGDMVRVSFRSSSENPLKIGAAYITRRNANEDGFVNPDPSGKSISEYHMHQQLFFKDTYDKEAPGGTDDNVEFAFIPAGSVAWSEWTAFPLIREVSGSDVYYFITFFVPDLGSVTNWPTGWSFDAGKTDSRYWAGSSPHSYYLSNGDYTTSDLIEASGTPAWSGVYTNWTSPNDIYVTAKIDIWQTTGTVESQIFDTALSAPAYNKIKWSEVIPSGTDVVLKARSSASSFMSGATVWDSITGTSTNPDTLSIGSGRYVQFLAELTTEPFWETPKPSSLSYYNYINDQTTPPNPDYEFPVDSDGEPYVT